MSLQLENKKNMKIFNNEPYKSILTMLSCYEKGLKQKHLAYELVKTTIEKKGKSTKNNKPRILQERKIVEYLKENKKEGCYYKDKITSGCIPHRQRLNECLSILRKNRLVSKGLKRFLLTPKIKDRLIMNYDLDTIGMYHSGAFMIKSVVNTQFINIYSPLLAEMYNSNNEVKSDVDKIVSDIEKSINKLNVLTKKVGLMRDKQDLKYFKKGVKDDVKFYLDMIDGERIILDEDVTKTGKESFNKTVKRLKECIKNPKMSSYLLVVHNRGTGVRSHRTFIK